jgi:hypothetical protein
MHIAAKAPAAPASRPPMPPSLRAGVVHGGGYAPRREHCVQHGPVPRPERHTPKTSKLFCSQLPEVNGNTRGCLKVADGTVKATCVPRVHRHRHNLQALPLVPGSLGTFLVCLILSFGGGSILEEFTYALPPRPPTYPPRAPQYQRLTFTFGPPYHHSVIIWAMLPMGGWGMLGDLRAYEHGSPDKC